MPLVNRRSGVSIEYPSDEIMSGGWFDYNDTATAGTPISVTGGAGFVKLTNDGLGGFTNKAYRPDGITDVWDAVTDQFDWSEIPLGAQVDIRLDLDVTTTDPNQKIEVDLFLGVGQPGEYNIPFVSNTYKTAGAQDVNRYNGIYMGDSFTRDNPAEFRIQSDGNCSVVVSGWYVRIARLG